MWCESKSQILSKKKIKIELIFGSIVGNVTLFFYCKSKWMSAKRSVTTLPVLFSAWHLKKNIFHVILYQLTQFYDLIVFTS